MVRSFENLGYHPKEGDNIAKPDPTRDTDFIIALRIAWAKKAVPAIKETIFSSDP
jgi:hypothetical protein